MRHGTLRSEFIAGLAIASATILGCSTSDSDSIPTPNPVSSSQTEQTPDTQPAHALDSVEAILRSHDAAQLPSAQSAIRLALQAVDEKTRIEAIRLAMHPASGLLLEVAALLTDPAVEVRRAAILAMAPAMAGDTDPGPELFFGSLHDCDTDIRDLAVSALKSRGLTDVQIELARKLVSPEIRDRLQLLVDLAYEENLVSDLGPWLERLSRDPEPAVRLGAARVAVEQQIPTHSWLERLAEEDPDPTVRQVATWYRSQVGQIRPVGFDEPVRIQK